MSDKATFAWADSLNLDRQLTKDKRQVHPAGCATKDLHMGQTVKSVLRMCGNFKLTAHIREGAQKCV